MLSSDSDDGPLLLHRRATSNGQRVQWHHLSVNFVSCSPSQHCETLIIDDMSFFAQPKKLAKSRSPSPLPDWLSQPGNSPVKSLEILDNSDDDAEALDEPSQNLANGNESGRGPAAEQSKQAANAGEVARAKRGRAALETSSDSGAEEPKTVLKRLKSVAKADQQHANTAKASRTGKSQQGITAWLKKQETSAAKLEPKLKPNSAAVEGPVELPGPSQKQVRGMAQHLLCDTSATISLHCTQ